MWFLFVCDEPWRRSLADARHGGFLRASPRILSARVRYASAVLLSTACNVGMACNKPEITKACCDYWQAHGPFTRGCLCRRSPLAMTTTLGAALQRAVANAREAGSEQNPLLDTRQLTEFRNELVRFNESCPTGFDGMVERSHRVGSGTLHSVYALKPEDALSLGVRRAIVRVETYEACDRSDEPYHSRLIDTMLLEAWMHEQMARASIGPRLLGACIQRRVPSGAACPNTTPYRAALWLTRAASRAEQVQGC